MNKKYIANASKPIGELGRKRVAEMNEHHAPLVHWAFSFLMPKTEQRCLDLGCGGGATIAYLLSALEASFCLGIDYSKVAIEEAEKNNAEAILEGKCQIIKGDVASLPCESESFGLVSAFETIYFWNEPLKALEEARRVLKTGGRIILVNEDDGEEKDKAQRLQAIMPSMRFYNAEQLASLLEQAGFKNVTIHSKSPWIAAIGEK